MALRQLPDAKARSSALNSTSTSFSAWAKVVGDTSGPTGGAVPKAGGAPRGSAGSWVGCKNAAATPNRARGAWVKNCLRDFDMSLLKRIANRVDTELHLIGKIHC